MLFFQNKLLIPLYYSNKTQKGTQETQRENNHPAMFPMCLCV